MGYFVLLTVCWYKGTDSHLLDDLRKTKKKKEKKKNKKYTGASSGCAHNQVVQNEKLFHNFKMKKMERAGCGIMLLAACLHQGGKRCVYVPGVSSQEGHTFCTQDGEPRQDGAGVI